MGSLLIIFESIIRNLGADISKGIWEVKNLNVFNFFQSTYDSVSSLVSAIAF